MSQLRSRETLFRVGIIAPWYLKPYQFPLYKLIASVEREIVVPNITRRFGKSTVCVCYSVEKALRSKKNIRYATAFLSDLEGFIEPIFDSILADCPEDIRPTWLASKKIWKFKNGSSIKLVGLDKNPNGIRGNAIDDIIIDEAAFVANLEYLYKSIIIPATMKRKFKLVFPSTPPVSPEHFWAKELIPKASVRGTYIELTIDSIGDLEADEKQRLLDEVGGEQSSTAQREFYCKIIVDETRAIAPSFSKDRHIGRSDDEHIVWRYIGDTGGVRDKTVFFQVGFSHRDQKIIIKSELHYPCMTPTPVIAEGFKKWSETDSLTLDAPGITRVDLAALGLKVSLPIKDDFAAGIQVMNATFHNDEVLIDPSCTLLTTTLTSGLLTKNRKDFERSEVLGHCDAAAGFIYSLRGADKVTDVRPKPKKSTMFTPPPKSHPLMNAFN